MIQNGAIVMADIDSNKKALGTYSYERGKVVLFPLKTDSAPMILDPNRITVEVVLTGLFHPSE